MKKLITALLTCAILMTSQILPIHALNIYETEVYEIDPNSYEASLVPSLNFTVEPWTVGDVAAFPVYQKGVLTSQAGICGMGVVAQVAAGPLKIYVARTTVERSLANDELAYYPSAIARVTDPDGNLAAVVDFADLTNGSRAHVITIPNAKAGIWTVQMMNGRTGDVVEIGLSACTAWGVRGEKILGLSETTPKTAYLYAPRTAEFIYLGASGSNTSIKLYNASGTLKGTTAAKSRGWIQSDLTLELVEADSVYKIEIPSAFSGSIAIDGITGLLCPTADMALALKGGWVDSEGTMCQGPLQARAREELIRLASTKNLSVDVTKPATPPENLENPMAEAQMVGALGVTGSLAYLAEHQITDVNNPYIGLTRFGDGTNDPNPYEGETDKAGFEACNFLHSMYAGRFAQAASMPLELNYAKGHEGYVTRAAMVMLYNVMMLSEDSYLRVYNLKTHVYPLTGGMFVFADYQRAYSMIADYLDDETRDILFQGLLLINDKQGDYRGQGVTNQGMYHMSAQISIYNYTGIERYHNTFKRMLRANLDRTSEAYGVASPGYFVELVGCDGSYEYMNRMEFYNIYNIYKKTKTADQTLMRDFKSAVEKTLRFESYFCAPQPEECRMESMVIAPNCFVTRNPVSYFGGGGEPSYTQLFHEFPMAARRMQVFDAKNKDPNSSLYGKYSATQATYLINNEEWANAHIKSAYRSYEDGYQQTISSVYPFLTYDAYAANSFAEPCLLPCEEPDGSIFEETGFIALKHKGIYLYSFYGTEPFNGHYARNTAYMGGGPTGVWTAETGTTLSSVKHLSAYEMPTSPDEIMSSCMYGYEAGSTTMLFSGKEGDFSGGSDKAEQANTLTWLEPNKSFRIEGTLHNSDKKASWTYTLDNEGISVTAKMSDVKAGDEFWLNLPITVKDANLDVSYQPGKVTTVYNDDASRSMVYSWDSTKEAMLLDKEGTTKRLRIKLDENGEATFRISTQTPDLQLIDFGFSKFSGNQFVKVDKLEKQVLHSADFTVQNNLSGAHKIVIVFAVYDKNNQLIDITSAEKTVLPSVREKLSSGLLLSDEAERVQVMVFKSLSDLRPLMQSFHKTVSDENS